MLEQTETPLTERKVVRRGLIAALAGLGGAVMVKLSGVSKAEAGVDGDLFLNNVNVGTAQTTLNSSPAGGGGYTLLKLENFRIADGLNAIGGPGSLGNTGGRGINATGGSNSAGTFALASNAGDAILATGGNTTGGVGNGGKGLRAIGGAAGSGAGGAGVDATGGAPNGTGVRGVGGGTAGSQGIGVQGFTNSTTNAGVLGSNAGSGPGVRGDSTNGAGVLGTSVNQPGLDGTSTNSLGIRGTSTNFVGIVGISTNNHGLYGSTNGVGSYGIVAENLAGGPGLFVQGNSVINGSLQVIGAKNAIIKMADGSDASVYCQESPEPYFEDFGRAQLVGGVANVALEREFAQLVAGGDYMVFCFPEGLTGGLYVSRRGPGGFEVREASGAGNVSFTYRIVTKRKDIEGRRFARVDLTAMRQLAVTRAALGVNGGSVSNQPSAPPAPQPFVPPAGPVVQPAPAAQPGPGLTVQPPVDGPQGGSNR